MINETISIFEKEDFRRSDRAESFNNLVDINKIVNKYESNNDNKNKKRKTNTKQTKTKKTKTKEA